MEMTVFIIVFVIMLIFGNSVALALGVPSFFYLMFVLNIPLVSIMQRMTESLNTFPILAAPLFIMAGNLMNDCGITEKIFNFANNLVKHLRGGLAHANIIASIIFSGMSGSALADAGGLGSVEIKAMVERNYSKEFSVGITGASSIIGPIIPPSIPVVIYAVTAGTSVGKLFIAGIIPGLIMGVSLSLMCIVISRRENLEKIRRASFKELIMSFLDSFPSLFTIVIILGGIISGLFTPTEAAGIAVAYIIFIGVFLYRTITVHSFIKNMRTSARTTIKVAFIIATASLFGQVIIREQVANYISDFMLNTIENPVIIIITINIILLFLGTFLEQIAAILIITPIFLPLMESLGYSPIQFGIMAIINLMIGLLTPPLGIVLYALSDVSELPLNQTIRGIAPFLLPLIVCLMLIAFIPQLTLFLPNLIW